MTYLVAQALMTSIEDAWLANEEQTLGEPRIVDDVRNVVPPCVLMTPPARSFDVACGSSLTWTIVALAPGPATSDTWRALDQLVEIVSDGLGVEEARPSSYRLDATSDPLPCYLITYRGVA